MGKKAAVLPTGQSQYQVVGRFVPNEKYGEENAMCKVYRMNLFAKNKVVARSRFWYFMGRMCRVKKANGQIISVNQVCARPVRSACWRACLSGVRNRGAQRVMPTNPAPGAGSGVACAAARSGGQQRLAGVPWVALA